MYTFYSIKKFYLPIHEFWVQIVDFLLMTYFRDNVLTVSLLLGVLFIYKPKLSLTLKISEIFRQNGFLEDAARFLICYGKL